jgi:hypothetical protein
MNNIRLIYPILEQLKQVVDPLNTPDSLDGLLAVHFDTHQQLNRKFNWCDAVEPNVWISQQQDIASQAPKVGTLGALLASQATRTEQIDEDAADIFHQGLVGLQKRKVDFFSSTSWILQPNIVLAIALGIRTTGDIQVKMWFTKLISEGIGIKSIPLLPRLMYGYVLYLFNVEQVQFDIVAYVGDFSTCSLPELALSIWLARHEIGEWSSTKRSDWLQSAQVVFWERMLTEPPYETEDYKAALLWEVIVSYISTTPLVDSSARVSDMLSNFPAALERWKKDWKIEDEEDVQRLVFLILRTYFDDLRYEDNLPKLGRSGHRYDIGIPQLKLLIEIKFARKSSDFQRFVEEIGKDAAQIVTQTVFTGFTAFIYDPTCSTEHYAWIRQALLQYPQVKDVVIVCAPAVCR